MPRYFFHLHDGIAFPDREGVDLPDDDSARAEASRSFGGFVGELGLDAWAEDGWSMHIEDANGRSVGVLTFKEGLTQPLKPSTWIMKTRGDLTAAMNALVRTKRISAFRTSLDDRKLDPIITISVAEGRDPARAIGLVRSTLSGVFLGTTVVIE